jgi:uncharacterized membrane protein
MRRASLVALYVLSFVVGAYAFGMYAFGPGSQRLHPEMHANFVTHPVGISTHIFASALALLLGPFQFSMRLRSRWPTLHRWIGRVYLGVAVLLGGIAGLYMSYFAFGGIPAKLGFALLACAWLFTGTRAYMAARTRDFAAHRRRMIRNYGLTFAAVTLRLYLPPVFVFQLPFELAYPVIAWVCWVPNLVVAEWLAKSAHDSSLQPTRYGLRPSRALELDR